MLERSVRNKRSQELAIIQKSDTFQGEIRKSETQITNMVASFHFQNTMPSRDGQADCEESSLDTNSGITTVAWQPIKTLC